MKKYWMIVIVMGSYRFKVLDNGKKCNQEKLRVSWYSCE